LRARSLTALSNRRTIANGLRRVVQDACQGAPISRARISPRRAAVSAASVELTQLADALARPGPVTARGVAQARMLLTDGTGPLYNSKSPGSLEIRAARAAEHLRPEW
jgi:hypothetical protein